MKLLIDDAHIDKIKTIYEFYPVDGVTTNPSILAKAGRNPYEVLGEIRSFIGKDADLHVQAVAQTAEGMVEDAHRIVKELGTNTFVKIPAVREGFKAMKMLMAEGIRVTATAIYTPMQAYLAGKCGASYAAPYRPHRQYGIQWRAGGQTDPGYFQNKSAEHRDPGSQL